MRCSCTGAYLIASCQQEVQDAGILIAEEVLSKLLIFFVKLQTCSETSRCERCWNHGALAAGFQTRTWNCQ